MVNFVCVYWGNKYPLIYLQNLYNMVQKNLTIPHNFICFTDKDNLPISGNIDYRKLPRKDLEGWWNKMQLFSPDSNLIGQNLYLDLDVVILDNINELATFGDDKTFGVINDFNPTTKVFNSSVLKFNNEITTEAIWNPYINNLHEYHNYSSDQVVMSILMKNNIHTKIMPDEWTFSYKWFSRTNPRYDENKHTYELKKNSKISVFHGRPNPHESMQEWVVNNWK